MSVLLVRPRINAGNQDLADITADVWDAIEEINKPPMYFRFGDTCCRLELDDNRLLKPVPLTPDRLRHELAKEIDWFQNTKQGETPAKTPVDVVKNVLATPNPPLPILERISPIPVFAPDGTLQIEPGYREAGRVFYEPPKGLVLADIPQNPSQKQIESAKSLVLEDLLGDFPFVGDSDVAHAFALFLLPYTRDMIVGPTPNHEVESPVPGTGKDLLVEACLRPALGQGIAFLTQAHDEEEWRRRITSILKQASGAVLITNITKPLDSGTLAGALVGRHWSDRILGRNEIIRLPIRCIWASTANNPSISTELLRRSIRIRLDAQCERPWERTEFRHRNLRSWIDANRADLVRAGLVLVQAWVAAGRPQWTEKVLGSYEEWTAIMGGILQVVGIKGFLGNLDDLYESSYSEQAQWGSFLDSWWEKFGSGEMSVADLLPVACDCGFDLASESEQGQKVSLGKTLKQCRDQIINGYRITLTRQVQRASRWRLTSKSRLM